MSAVDASRLDELLPWIAIGAMATGSLALGGAWVAADVGAALAHAPAPPGNPLALLVASLSGQYRWPLAALPVALFELAIVAAALYLPLRRAWRHRPGKPVDRAARFLASRRETHGNTFAGAAATAARLGAPTDVPGVGIGRRVPDGAMLYGTWEDVQVDIWGPRTGKTSSRAIPNILDAPGAVVVTSNRRDVVDATRGPREKAGRVWVFDPQEIVGEPSTWWWDPLTYVADDIDQAAKLAALFASSSRRPGAQTDAFFEPAGQELLAMLLLAASVGERPITQVYTWSTRPKDDEPERILRDAGHVLGADAIAGVIGLPDKTRGSIFGTAKQMAGFLVSPRVNRWVTPDPDAPGRPAFDARRFVQAASGTLYLISREGTRTAGPLTTALTVAVAEAAEHLANTQPGGRLATPLLGVLDEAANVCRWEQLPDLYSHFGGRGIVLMVILQSWSQGVEVWGERGMAKLWGAANVRVYGGGAADTAFLGDLGKIAGEFDRWTTSTSRASGSPISRSRSGRREQILEVSELAALPRGRAFVQLSGSRPVLVATVPWMAGPHADAVRASITRYDPTASASAVAAP